MSSGSAEAWKCENCGEPNNRAEAHYCRECGFEPEWADADGGCKDSEDLQCPSCGTEHEGWKMEHMGDGDVDTMECWACGVTFELMAHVQVTFDTGKATLRAIRTRELTRLARTVKLAADNEKPSDYQRAAAVRASEQIRQLIAKRLIFNPTTYDQFLVEQGFVPSTRELYHGPQLTLFEEQA